MKFVDLFAGLGGFHLALADLGYECVFASEIDAELQSTYLKNFGMMPAGDIRKLNCQDIPPHDILCAGFPCQPFSKAGRQRGLADKERGRLFYEILRVVETHRPKYIILENVPHIRRQGDGKAWNKIGRLLSKEGYDVKSHDLSPHQFGIPQIRLRTYIVAARDGLNGFSWPQASHDAEMSVKDILDRNPAATEIPQRFKECIDIWQEFLDILPPKEEIPKPLWAMEFGATYPYKRRTPHSMSLKRLRRYRGSFGLPLTGKRRKTLYGGLPSHARRSCRKFPPWKIRMIGDSRAFYNKHKKLLIPWMKKIQIFPSSYQKLEWNIEGGQRKMRSYIVQFRPSGVRVKKLTTAPSLVAMNVTQVPIVTWENRYMTPRECSRLQSMESLRYLPERRSKAYSALGNAVNVAVVKHIAVSLLKGGEGAECRDSH